MNHVNGRSGQFNTREVIVADPSAPRQENWPPACSEEQEAIRDFKVFMKKNLAFQKPAPDLLVKIHQRIDKIKLDKDIQ